MLLLRRVAAAPVRLVMPAVLPVMRCASEGEEHAVAADLWNLVGFDHPCRSCSGHAFRGRRYPRCVREFRRPDLRGPAAGLCAAVAWDRGKRALACRTEKWSHPFSDEFDAPHRMNGGEADGLAHP